MISHQDALDIFDGLMLGDAGLNKWRAGTRFVLGLSKPLCAQSEVRIMNGMLEASGSQVI